MTTDDVLTLIGGEAVVRDYLRGVEPGSEIDRDAMRAMRAAIARMRAGGVRDAMAEYEPELYGDACLALCQMRTDADTQSAPVLARQASDIMLLLRTDKRNIDDNEGEVTDNG